MVIRDTKWSNNFKIKLALILQILFDRQIRNVGNEEDDVHNPVAIQSQEKDEAMPKPSGDLTSTALHRFPQSTKSK